jgi:iron-sulfur cluster repair protein YtfE (RIC family)
MLVGLGTSAPRLHDGDLVDLLLDCHRRIRRFATLALTLGDDRHADPTDVQQTARSVLRYFTVGLPLHVRDEDDAILPRLRGRDRTIDRALATMTREHREHQAGLARVVAACAAIADHPQGQRAARSELSGSASALQAAFTAHLETEETIVFPGIRRLLEPAQQAAILAEFRDRRLPRPA